MHFFFSCPSSSLLLFRPPARVVRSGSRPFLSFVLLILPLRHIYAIRMLCWGNDDGEEEEKKKKQKKKKKNNTKKNNIKNNKFQKDDTPLDKRCKNLNLNKYSKNYLKHLFNTNEILGSMLLTLHNINFYQELMALIRKNINDGTFDQFHDKYIDKL